MVRAMTTSCDTHRAGLSPRMRDATECGPLGKPGQGLRRDLDRRQGGRQTVGILNINKSRGLTSHDVVDIVRRVSRQRRVGHSGTLDPLATGVLVVLLGKATRLAEYVADRPKSYLATVHFGVITDTWDAEGRVVETRDSSDLSVEVIERALARFKGAIEQVPPMYSAIKRDGQRLYHLARQGITVRRDPRWVEIYQTRVVDWCTPELVVQIDCAKGTYIRSLAHDLGQAVGTGAHLSDLTRLAVGGFLLEDAVSLASLLDERANDHQWKRHLLPMRAALGHMPGVTVDLGTARRISCGQGVQLEVATDARLCCAYTVQVENGEPQLLAVLRHDQKAGLWRPDKVLRAL